MDILKKLGSTGKNTMLAEIMQTGDELASEVSRLRQEHDALAAIIDKEAEDYAQTYIENKALAAIVKQMRYALSMPCDRWNKSQSEIINKALAIDISQAEAILRKRDAEVLLKAADKLCFDPLLPASELRRMADDILKS